VSKKNRRIWPGINQKKRVVAREGIASGILRRRSTTFGANVVATEIHRSLVGHKQGPRQKSAVAEQRHGIYRKKQGNPPTKGEIIITLARGKRPTT